MTTTRTRPRPGDHLKVSRGAYAHHGLYLGWGRVIHYAGEPFDLTNACVRIDPLDRFARTGVVVVIEYDDCSPPVAAIARAFSRLGEREYGLVRNNCEHFARWCKTGEAESKQVQVAVATVAALAVAAVGLGAKALVERRRQRTGDQAAPASQ